MPTYEYRCAACGHELELFQNISESPKKKCPKCSKLKLKRKIGGGAGFLFKGSGFYLTDYRSDSYKKAADADGKSAESKPADGKSDSKSAAPGSGATQGSGSDSGGKKASAPAPETKTEKKSRESKSEGHKKKAQ